MVTQDLLRLLYIHTLDGKIDHQRATFIYIPIYTFKAFLGLLWNWNLPLLVFPSLYRFITEG